MERLLKELGLPFWSFSVKIKASKLTSKYMISTVLIFLIVLGILVFVHEAGHFMAARKMGMVVEEFGLGFPPKILSKKGKDGTIYSLNLIPLGGFCKIKGEDGENRDESGSFGSKKPWRRAIVLVAGVTMNFLLCAVLLSFGYMFGLPQVIDQQALDAGIVKEHKIQVLSVLDDKPAKAAGIEVGDLLISVDGQPIISVQTLVNYTTTKIGQNVSLVVERDKEQITKEINIVEIDKGRGGIGVELFETGIVKYPVHLAIYNGFKISVISAGEYLMAFGKLIVNLVIGNGFDAQVSGPVGIAVMTGQAAQRGFIYLLYFTAVISLSLAVINICPFPALDGGRLLFILIEKIRRKPVSHKIEAVIHTLGFGVLMILIILVTFQDLLRYSNLFSNFFSNLI